MTPGEPMTYLETAKAVLGSSPATKATKATKGSLGAVWKAGGWLVISDDRIRAVRVPPELRAWVARHQAETLHALLRNRFAPVVQLRRSRSDPRPVPRRGRR
jgi:hypothetical protein